MTRRHESDDVFAAAVPDDLNPEDPQQEKVLLDWLDQVARQWVWAQWLPNQRPLDVEFAVSEWLITKHVWKVDEFQPAHDCEECRSGNEKAKTFLRDNPGRWIAMANMRYTEIWP